MFSTVSSLHTAIEFRIQQMTSNRKLSILPQQYDFAINQGIDNILKRRVNAKLNSVQEGYEDTVKRYLDTSSLVREYKPKLFIDNTQRQIYFYLPSNCQYIDVIKSDVYYSRRDISINILNAIRYVSIVRLFDTINKSDLIIYNNNSNIDLSKYTSVISSYRGLFTFLDLIPNYVKQRYSIDTYINQYDDINESTSIILQSYDSKDRITSVTQGDFENKEYIDRYYDINTKDTQMIGTKLIQLNKNYDHAANISDYYSNQNRHLAPMYRIVGRKVLIDIDSTFGLNNLIVTYIKKPDYVNSTIEQNTDVTIKDELVDLVATDMSGILKDATYQYNVNKENTNN